MNQRKPILVLSDLTPHSDAALHFAGSLAQLVNTEMFVLHGMSLRHRPLRAVMPALENLDATMAVTCDVIRAQVQRVIPAALERLVPVVDVDDPMRAMQRRAIEIEPMVVIAPPLWDWAFDGRQHRRTRAPLFVVRGNRENVHNRVIVVSHLDSIDTEIVEEAGRWAFWSEQIYPDRRVREAGPDFDLLTLDDTTVINDVLAGVVHDASDLIVIDRTLYGQPERADIAGLMPTLLSRSEAPIVFATS